MNTGGIVTDWFSRFIHGLSLSIPNSATVSYVTMHLRPSAFIPFHFAKRQILTALTINRIYLYILSGSDKSMRPIETGNSH